MKFNEILLQGTLVKRYKRFFVDIKYNSKIITAHCPNTGSMLGLLNADNKVWFSKSNNPKRKLKYTLEIIEVNGKKIGINTLIANKIVLEGMQNKKIISLIKFVNIKAESKFNDETRFDFLLTNNKDKCFLEVKNVTLFRNNKTAEFHDAVSSRGLKHLNKGYKSYILYLIQREGCDSFKIAGDIDEKYKIAFAKAVKSGVKVLCYDCKLNNEEIKLNKQINYEQ